MSEGSKDDGPVGKGLSFGFSKKLTQKPKFVPKEEIPEEKDYIRDVKHGKIEGSKPKEEKPALVIPCTGNKIKFQAPRVPKSEVPTSQGIPQDAEASLAAQELLADAKQWQEERETGTDLDPNFVVPLNPDDKDFLDADVATRANVSSMEDYDNIPVEGFGLGMLRGMGFKEGQGIGGFKQAAVGCIEPTVRPKGLGLGAAKPNSGKTSNGSKNPDDEDLVLKKNGFVVVESGAHKNLYGQVEGLDEDTARVIVRLALGGQAVSVSENVIRVVSKKEFKEFGKVINKESYTKFKDKQREKEEQWDRERHIRDRDSQKQDRESKNETSTKERKRSRSRDRDQDRSKNRSRTWIRPLLRVRIIDKKYKSGKYYNTKAVVEDVTSNDTCVCRTDSGAYLDDVLTSKCETIVPKSDNSVVMIVRGSSRGRIATIIGRDKSSGRATVQILPDNEDIERLDYDDICEYVGDTSDFY